MVYNYKIFHTTDLSNEAYVSGVKMTRQFSSNMVGCRLSYHVNLVIKYSKQINGYGSVMLYQGSLPARKARALKL